MEPKLNDKNLNINFPREPQLNATPSAQGIPKIVPADFKVPPQKGGVTQDTPALDPATQSASTQSASTQGVSTQGASAQEGAPVQNQPKAQAPASVAASPSFQSNATRATPRMDPKDPTALMASLSKEINELSEPLRQPAQAQTSTLSGAAAQTAASPASSERSMPTVGQMGANGIRYPPEDDLGDPYDPPRSTGIVRSIFLFACLLSVIVAAWQVTLFLQPDFLQKEPFNTISEKSCEYLYCPPLRTPVVLASQMDAQSAGRWSLHLQVQNQDMRSQKLPILQLTLENRNKTVTQKIFEPYEYTVDPRVTSIKGGATVKIIVPFDYADGNPVSFRVKILDN